MFSKTVICKSLTNFLQMQKRFRKPETECWLPICNVEVIKIPFRNTEKCRVAGFLSKHYFPYEPMLIAAGLGVERADPGILQNLITAMNENKALYAMATDSKEILGVAIARTTTPQTLYELRCLADKMGTNKARRYMHALAQIEHRANVYKTFLVDRAWSVDVIATNKIFRRRGIAKMLLEGMKSLALENPKYDLLRFTATNYYGSQAALSCGDMKSYYKRPLSSYKDDAGKPWVKQLMCPPHKDIEVFTGNLRALKPVIIEKDTSCKTYGLETTYGYKMPVNQP